MALFGGNKKKQRGPLPEPLDPKWVHGGEGRFDPKLVHGGEGRFARFLDLDPEAAGLTGKSGVFVIWHTGNSPGWVYVGASANLAGEFFHLGENEEILEYRDRGSLFCSWAFVREEFQDGVICYLTMVLKPKVENPNCPDEDDDGVDLIPVLPPGMTIKQLELLFGDAQSE